MVEISVLLTIYNRKALFKRTLLGYKRFPPYENTELVIVDDQSTDGLEELFPLAKEVFGRVVHVVMDKKKSIIPVYFNNPALGLNIGVRKASGALIVKTDPECYPFTDTIRESTRIIAGQKRVLWGRCNHGSEALNLTLDQTGFLPRNEEDIRSRYPYNGIERTVVSASGVRGPWWFICAFRREDYVAIGGIDEQFLLGFAGEDDDWGDRMQRWGVQPLWDDAVSVLHQWHIPPQTKIDKQKHEDNKARLAASRVAQRVMANRDHDWGSDKAVIGMTVL